MAWRRDPDADAEEPVEPVASPGETRAKREVQSLLDQRLPHVAPRIENPEAAPPLDIPPVEESEPQAVYRGPVIQTPEFDPIFALMVIFAVGIGLLPVQANMRYVVLWLLLGAVGLVGYIIGNSASISDSSPDDLRTGVGLGLALGLPFLILMGGSLKAVSERMFDVDGVTPSIMDTWVLMAVAFVIPSVESLFFRGVIQQVHNFMVTVALATVWSIIVFYPHMSLGNATGVAVSIGLFFALLNFLYSYIQYRNGLAAAWICQIISGALIWFAPRLLF
jgi:hypothetical protein